jgi:hypothetical protein
MANNLSKSNIITGNIVEASDITQIIDALTATSAYNIIVSGSFAFSGSTTGSGWFTNAISSSRSITASYADFANTASFSTFAALANNSNSSSLATTANFALTASTPTQIKATLYTGSSSDPAEIKFIAGSAQTNDGSPPGTPPFVTNAIPIAQLVGFNPNDLGDGVYVTVSALTGSLVWVSDFNPPNITFESTLPDIPFHYHIIYKHVTL